MRFGIGGQSHENHIFFAGSGDLPTGGNATGIGEKNHLQKDFGVVSWCTSLIIIESGIEDREVKLVVDQVTQGEFKGAWLNLMSEMNGDEYPLITGIRFVFGH